MKLKEIASLVSGTIVGDEKVEIKALAPIGEAGPGELSFILDKKNLQQAADSRAAAFVCSAEASLDGKNLIKVANPRHAMAKILALFAPKNKQPKGIHKTAIVPKSCLVGKNVSIGPYVVVEETVSIGDNTIIYPHVWIGERCQIGKNVILHSGCRIGIDGFGYVQEGKKHIKIPQIGNVVIEDNVELFANVCVSRATLGSTIIGEGTKIDNLSHVAHNCKIGKNCAIVSLVGFAGSVTLKDNVYVAGQSGFNGHITIGENTVVMAKSGVTKDIPANMVVSGFPAQDHKKEIVEKAALKQLAKRNK